MASSIRRHVKHVWVGLGTFLPPFIMPFFSDWLRISLVMNHNPPPGPVNGINPTPGSRRSQLKRDLEKWQIFLLALSGIIGVTIFSTMGEILNTAGVGGLLIALLFVGATAIFVMECLSELVVLWPVPNALVEYVKKFVDEDLSTVVGIGYWYTWSSIFTGLLIAAYDFFCEFLPAQLPRVIIFVVIAFLLWGINALGVKMYGRIEAVGGGIKWANAIAGGCFLYAVIAKEGRHNDHAAFKYHKWEADNAVAALCMSIPILAYGLIGVEIVAVTAFEAKSREDLREPSRWIAWVMVATYLFCAIGGALAVEWNNEHLPELVPDPSTVAQRAVPGEIPPQKKGCQEYYPLIVIAAFQYGSKAAAWYFNACIVYFCISASNTALYVASRTLYGLMREEEPRDFYGLPWTQKIIQSPWLLGRVSSRRRVPLWSLLASAVAFLWLIALRATATSSAIETLVVVTTIGSVGGVLVWAAQCLAFIKYFNWVAANKLQIPSYYDRDAEPTLSWQHKRPFLSSYQPFIAWAGLIMCLLIVFVLNTATWWNGTATATKVASAFAGPGFLIICFIVLKIRRMWSVRPANMIDPLRVHVVLENLADLPIPLGNEGIPMRGQQQPQPQQRMVDGNVP